MKQYSDEIISKINAEVETCCVDGDLSSDKVLYMMNFSKEVVKAYYQKRLGLNCAILQGIDRAAKQPAGEHRQPAATGRRSAEKVEAGERGNQHPKEENRPKRGLRI